MSRSFKASYIFGLAWLVLVAILVCVRILTERLGPYFGSNTVDAITTTQNTIQGEEDKCMSMQPIRPSFSQTNLNPNDPVIKCSAERQGVHGASGCYNLTLVSAFISIGSFPKGHSGYIITPSTYLGWADKFRFLENPLVFYTDSQEMADKVRYVRRDVISPTQIIMTNRSSLWAFQIKRKIAALYRKPGYPKHLPNTVSAEYSCTQHAKYAVIEKAVKDNYFNSQYFSWIDVGYLRDYSLNLKIRLSLPKDFNSSKVSYNQVTNPNWKFTSKDIIYGNHVWVGGGFFIAQKDTMLTYIDLYKRSTLALLNMDLMSTDQQIIYSMYTTEGRRILMPNVELQVYMQRCTNPWFSFVYSIVEFV